MYTHFALLVLINGSIFVTAETLISDIKFLAFSLNTVFLLVFVGLPSLGLKYRMSSVSKNLDAWIENNNYKTIEKRLNPNSFNTGFKIVYNVILIKDSIKSKGRITFGNYWFGILFYHTQQQPHIALIDNKI